MPNNALQEKFPENLRIKIPKKGFHSSGCLYIIITSTDKPCQGSVCNSPEILENIQKKYVPSFDVYMLINYIKVYQMVKTTHNNIKESPNIFKD